MLVDFQSAGRGELIPAQVIEGGWHPQRPDGSGDIAVLALQSPLPAGAEPVPLRDADSVWGASVLCLRLPRRS